MHQQNNSAKEQLLKLEKLVKKVIRKSLKNNTLDYTVQITVSSIEPGKLKYAAHISSPAPGVEPVTMVFDSYGLLEGALEESVKEFSPRKFEIAFQQNRMNTFKNKIAQHEKRVKILENPDYDPETDGLKEFKETLEKAVKDETN